MDNLNREEEFFVAGGSMSRNARSYVRRKADDELVTKVLEGHFCYVFSPRQMGKSSLMIRMVEELRLVGVRNVIIDLTRFGIKNVSIDQWYQSMLEEFQRTLDLSVDPKKWWTTYASISYSQRFINYLRDVVLNEVDEPIVVFIDEIENTLHFNFKDDFFAAIRAVYNARPYEEIFKKITFVLLGVASPSDLINDRTRTPFNIGQAIDLEGFTQEEATVLRDGLERICHGQVDHIFSRIYDWTSGHPYFTQKLCLEVAEKRQHNWADDEIDNLIKGLFFSTIISESQEENLKNTQRQILQSPNKRELLILYKQVHEAKNTVKVDRQSILQNELMLSGLVQARGGNLEVRNNIYRQAFNFNWLRENLPWYSEYRVHIGLITVFVILTLVVAGYFYQINQEQPVDVLASSYIENFRSNTNPTLRLGSLANLIALPEREDDARVEFNSLTQAEKLSLFNIDTLDLQSQVRQVVRGIYFYLNDTGDDNEVLNAMKAALEQSDDPESEFLAKEISQWLEGRFNAAIGKFSEAASAYNTATVINEDNPAIHFEYAVVLIELKNFEGALAEFESALNLNKDWQPKIEQLIKNNEEVYNTWWQIRGMFPLIDNLMPTPTNTPTPTSTPTPTNTLELINIPTSTSTSTPTNTRTPTPRAPTRTPTAPITIATATPTEQAPLPTPTDQNAEVVEIRPEMTILDVDIPLTKPEDLYVVVEGQGIFKNENGGEGPWMQLLNSESVTSLVIDPANPATLYAPSWEAVYKSTDGGRTWDEKTTGMQNAKKSVDTIAVDPNNPELLYAGLGEILIVSDDGGDSWTSEEHGIGLGLTRIYDIVVDPFVSNVIYAGGLGGSIFKSIDSGRNFIRLAYGTGEGTFGLAIHPSKPGVLLAGINTPEDGIIKTENGADFRTVSYGLVKGGGLSAYSAITFAPSNPEIVYASSGYEAAHLFFGVFKSTNGGNSWERISENLPFNRPGGWPHFARSIAVHPLDPDILYVATGAGLYKSVDGGKRWVIGDYTYCTDANIKISSPAMNEAIEGIVTIFGTANISDFGHYEIQYYSGAQWNTLYKGYESVIDGPLMQWHTYTVPKGVYGLRLILHREESYLEPCVEEIQVGIK